MRERGVALTTAVITKINADAPERTIAEEIDAAYAERDEQLATETDLVAFASTLEIMGIDPEEMILGTMSTTPRVIRPHRRANPRARSMCHEGCKYVIRKDHGTTAFYKEITAAKAEIEKDKQSPRTIRRRQRKNALRSGNRRRSTAQR